MRALPVLLGLLLCVTGMADESAPLVVEAKISLPGVKGRIDHLAVDVPHRRLYVAALGNNTLEIIDLAAGKHSGSTKGFDDPQGIAFMPRTGVVYVANGGDGSLHVLPRTERISAQVNAGEIAVVDRATRKQIAGWPTGGLRANFAMALDESNQQLLVSFRRPAMLAAFSLANGKELARVPTCSDADDVFIDAKRDRAYLSCGEGFVDVLAKHGGVFHARVGRLQTIPGARTALFSRDLDRLFLAARANGSEPAAIWVLRPTE